jgi:hypothetical protein
MEEKSMAERDALIRAASDLVRLAKIIEAMEGKQTGDTDRMMVDSIDLMRMYKRWNPATRSPDSAGAKP